MVIVINEQQQATANAASHAIALYALTQLPKKAKLKYQDFMPFKPEKKTDDKGMMPQTMTLLKKLIKQRVLPARVEAAAMRDTGVLNG